MMHEIQFHVTGCPVAQPRVKARRMGNRAGVYTPSTANAWKAAIAGACKPHHGLRLTQPLRVSLWFTFPRPKGHYGSGKNASRLKDNAPHWKAGKPDCDNLEKAVFDTLTDVQLWADDGQVVDVHTSKVYGDLPGVEVTINEAHEFSLA